MLHISQATTDAEMKIVRSLFLEYAETLGFELDFQHFDRDLNELPGQYGPPEGRLLLARWEGEVAGCVALRKHDSEACEMKRLWVKPQFRGKGIGRALAEKLISEARESGYRKMLLDTIETMTEALSLYRSLGFAETTAYYDNPIDGATYFERGLTET
ncbi:MAG: GNAT family N-acetyltransferase [Candidatus Zixiibacteriota bacterium]|nr:MAG: GNAT family N-acetyltransferase [candidate division Zixibacteria bacterium]